MRSRALFTRWSGLASMCLLEPADETRNPVFDLRRRTIAEQLARPADVGEGALHVAGLRRPALDAWRHAERVTDQRDEPVEPRRLGLAEVRDLERRAIAGHPVAGRQDPLHDVVHIRVVALRGPVTELLDR